MPGYPFTIQDVPFYAATLPLWQAYGQQQAYTAGGQPTPFGPGAFSVTLNAVSVVNPADYGGDFATSGTHQQLFNIFVTAQDTTDGVVTVVCFDPRVGDYITIRARMKPPMQLAGGAAISGVLVEFYSAFISDEVRETYYGGDPTPLTDPLPYIPGDPIPTPAPGTFGWNVGTWNDELWNRGA
jgi:hypothetical protein